MEITIKGKFEGQNYWESKTFGVVLVEKDEHINLLWKLLCKQDEYWECRKDVIKVAPKEISSISELSTMCIYVGKTEIYNIKELQDKIPFILHQIAQDEVY